MNADASDQPKPVVLVSTSRAQDAGYLAAADIQQFADETGTDYRLIGGISVTLLTLIHGVSDRVPGRDTADADLGAAHRVLVSMNVVSGLHRRGCRQVAGNRFERQVYDLNGDPLRLAIDVLAPGYTSHLVSNVPLGSELVVDEVPGLALALAMPATWCTAEVRLSTGGDFTLALPLPNIVAAPCLKAFAYRGRLSRSDALDLWRLLECAHAAGLRADDWRPSGARGDAALILHNIYGRPGTGGPEMATMDARLSQRIRALLLEVVPRG